MHYIRWRKHGDPNHKRAKQISCTIPGCDKTYYARGWCHVHYMRWKRHGDPNYTPPPRRKVTHEEINAQQRARYAANPKAYRARTNALRKANPTKARAAANARYAAKPEQYRAADRARYAANPEKYRAPERAKRKADPAKYRAYERNSRNKRRGAGGDGVPAMQEDALYDAVGGRFGGRCTYCEKETWRLELDHIIPLKPRAGEPQGQHTLDNVIPACHSCNGSKKRIPLAEWWRGRGVRALRLTIKRVHREARALLEARAAV